MFKPFALVFFVLVMTWFGAIFLQTDPQGRMNTACSPVGLAGKIATSGMMVLHEDWAAGTANFFAQGTYMCQFILWRTFYGDEWNRAQAAKITPAVRHKEK